MKIIYLVLALFISEISFSQFLVNIPKNHPCYDKYQVIKDSIKKIIIKPDIKSIYRVTKIIDSKTNYIIYAKKINGKAGKAINYNVPSSRDTNFLYRIKSKKQYKKCSNQKIKVDKKYQLDLRDYDNTNQRLHFMPGVAINLITNGGFGYFDEIVHIDEEMSKDYYNKAMNLRGLCLCKKKKQRVTHKK